MRKHGKALLNNLDDDYGKKKVSAVLPAKIVNL